MARVAIAYVEVRPDLGGFAAELRTKLAAVKETKTVQIKADTSHLNDQISRVARRSVRPIKQRIEPTVDRKLLAQQATGALRSFSNIFGSGTLGRIIQLSLKSAASIIDAFSEQAVRAFDAVGTAMFTAGVEGGKFGQLMAKISLQVASAGIEFVAAAGAMGGLAVAAGLAGIAMSAINIVLGAVLAVVIPLVGAITALLAELVALGSVGAGALGLIPGALAAIGAAMLPLTLVMDKFKALFEKTADAVGPLYEVFERLKNAIFAVISSGFVKAFTNLATTVLPQMLTNLLLVLGAWNKLILLVFKMAAAPGVLAAVNAALQMAAYALNLFATLLAQVGPQFTTLITDAVPALTMIANSIATVVHQLGTLVGVMSGIGVTEQFFNRIAAILSQMLTIVAPLADLMMSWIVAILPAAQQFASILGGLVTRWGELARSAQGQEMILAFFVAMNNIVRDFEPILETVVSTFLKFGPTLATLVSAAVPALDALIQVFGTLLTTMAPGIVGFLEQFTTMLAAPETQAAMAELGTAIGTLVNAFGGLKPETMAGIISVFSSLIRLTATLVDTIWPLTDAVVAVIEVGLKQLEPWLKFIQAGTTTTTKAFDWLVRKLIEVADKFGSIPKAIKAAGDWLNSLATKLGLTSDKTGALAAKVDTNSKAMAADFKEFARRSGINIDGVSGALTGFANAQAWQTIMDNAKAAADAIANVGQTAFDTSQLQGEKMLGRKRQAERKIAKKAPKPNLKPLTDAWLGGWNETLDTATKKKPPAPKKKVTNKFVSNLTPTIKKLDLMDMIQGGKAFDTGKEIATYLAKGITSGAANVKKATDVIYKANKKKLDQFAASMKTFADKSRALTAALPKTWAKDLKTFTSIADLDNYLADQQNVWKGVLGEIIDFKNAVRDALVPDKGLVGVFGYLPTPAEVKARFNEQLRQIREFGEGIKALQAKGLDPELARQWLAAGVEGAGNMVQGLKDATKGEIDEISKAYRAVNTEADKVAEDQAIAWKGVGQSTVEGYIEGIQGMRDLVTKTMVDMMSAAQAAAKKALGIASPSKVFDSIGIDTIAGFVQGVDSMVGDSVSAVADLYQTVANVPPSPLTPRVRPGLANVGTLSGVAETAPSSINVRVYIGDKELTDIARVVVENADTNRARALLAGRRGG